MNGWMSKKYPELRAWLLSTISVNSLPEAELLAKIPRELLPEPADGIPYVVAGQILWELCCEGLIATRTVVVWSGVKK